MNIQSAITLIEANDLKNSEEMKCLLIKIADNILKNPESNSYRTLKKTNLTVSNKILTRPGGREMLLLMGFNESGSEYVFVDDKEKIKRLHEVRQTLNDWRPVHKSLSNSHVPGNSSIKENNEKNLMLKPIRLPPLVHKFTNQFLRKVTESFHEALVYNNVDARENAKKKIPIKTIQINALKRLRNLQKSDKPTLIISLQELEMVELLRWFKNDFFTWVDSPDCQRCGNETKFTHLNTDEKLNNMYTNRIEMYKCTLCGEFTQFPRYRDLNILLETRKGRCGEWAIIFTLMCIVMGWDSRLVLDETDHVWTEVYSNFQKRWIHCDPCDNICDTPLIYEHGWKKKLTYIIAYSPEELQDVTWRYSSNHKELVKRRNKCKENDLVDAIVKLRDERLKTLTQSRRKFIINRTLMELAELLVERQPKDEEMQGRSSGSLDWRISRGETDQSFTQNSFEFTDEHLENNKITIKYCASSDYYETSGCLNGTIIENWSKGIYDQKNMMRKEELDWKQVYLCRQEDADSALISWKIVLKDTTKHIVKVSLKFNKKTFENGEVSVYLSSDKTVMKLPQYDDEISTNDFNGCQTLLIEARLSGGKGGSAWQHAQLFRQSLDSAEFPFELEITVI